MLYLKTSDFFEPRIDFVYRHTVVRKNIRAQKLYYANLLSDVCYAKLDFLSTQRNNRRKEII